jgi:hypothetical protein
MLFISVSLFGQKGFQLSLEYSPSFSSVTNSFDNDGLRFSQNGFIKMESRLSKNISLTGGFGYMETKNSRLHIFFADFAHDKIEHVYSHRYVVAPVGVKVHFGSFYIQPEVGLAYNFSNITSQTTHFTSGIILRTRFNDTVNHASNNKFTTPLFLTIGNEFKIGTTTLLVGLKSYYSLNPMASSELDPKRKRYYGFGLLTGLRF